MIIALLFVFILSVKTTLARRIIRDKLEYMYPTYLNSSVISPLIRASVIGVPRHAGTKYSKAGCAALNVCITKTVTTRPTK